MNGRRKYTKRPLKRSYKKLRISRNLNGSRTGFIEVGFMKSIIAYGHANFDIHTISTASEEFGTYTQLYSYFKIHSVSVTWINRAQQVTGQVAIGQEVQLFQAAVVPAPVGIQAIREGLYDPSGNQVSIHQIVKIPGSKIWRLTTSSTIYKKINTGNWFSASEPVGASSQAAHVNYLVDFDSDIPGPNLDTYGYFMIKVRFLVKGKKL